MRELIGWFAIPMERPQSYSTFHLVFTFVGITTAIVLAFLLRKLNNKQNKILLGVIGAALAVSEIVKILFTNQVINGGNFAWWVFPFQLCSIPMYLCLISAFVKNERVNSYIYEFLFAISLTTAIMPFIEPSGLHKDYVFLTLHSYIWHLTLIFLGFYMYFSKRACTDKYGFLKGLSVYGIVVLIAFILNLCIREPGFNAFYMSPFVPSQIIVFDKIYYAAGWFVSNLAYVFAISAACAMVYYIAYMFRVSKQKRLLKKTNKG